MSTTLSHSIEQLTATLNLSPSLEHQATRGRFHLDKTTGQVENTNWPFAVTWRAIDTATNRPVFVKFIPFSNPPQGDGYPQDFFSFLIREGEVQQRIHAATPIVPQVIATHLEPDVGLFVVMEYISGQDVVAFTQQEPKIDNVLTVFKEIATHLDTWALDFRPSFLHRDLKPGHLIVSNGDVHGKNSVSILDVGLSNYVNNDYGMGSPFYLSPERLQGIVDGKPLSEITDFSSEIFSFGLIAFEAITGERFFGNPRDNNVNELTLTLEILDYVGLTNSHQASLSSVEQHHGIRPGTLVQIFNRALHRTPSQRYKTASEFIKDLENAFQNTSAQVEYAVV